MTPITELDRFNNLVAEIKRDIDSICSIYPTVGEAMYDEPKSRLAQRIANRILSREKEVLSRSQTNWVF